jgi:hypothetical protein
VSGAASIHARLLNGAKLRGEDFNHVFMRYAIERFLYRLSITSARKTYCLKGALLFSVWFDTPHRPTHDADFLVLGLENVEQIRETMRNICAIQVNDGMVFHPSSITIQDIRQNNKYGGYRVQLNCVLGKARCSLQLDLSFGEAITPAPDEIAFPTLLSDLLAPNLRVYPRATVAAEKLEAIVSLGMSNSRMKDYFDLRALAVEGVLDQSILAKAIAATFRRRATPFPNGVPIGLSDEFAVDTNKKIQWRAFVNKNQLRAPELIRIVRQIREFVMDPLLSAAQSK